MCAIYILVLLFNVVIYNLPVSTFVWSDTANDSTIF